MSQPKFIGKVKLTKQGQITLPQEARHDLDITKESELYWYEMNNYLILAKDLENLQQIEKKIKKR